MNSIDLACSGGFGGYLPWAIPRLMPASAISIATGLHPFQTVDILRAESFKKKTMILKKKGMMYNHQNRYDHNACASIVVSPFYFVTPFTVFTLARKPH